MATLVASAQDRLVDLITETKGQITTPQAWPTVSSYGPWLEEVWTNYISNALKYGGRPPLVTLGYDELPSAQDGKQVRFWAQDNGLGLTPEQQQCLFIEFGRLDNLNVQGYGLGLSIVRRIIEKLDGQVGVESQVGQGSKFYFTLPVDPLA
jgi:signal transduction histidine kinase